MTIKIIEKQARNAFVRTRIPGASWVLNPYVGCQFACAYCYAQFMCRWKQYGPWGTWVEVKTNFPELVKGKKKKGKVIMSSVSDAYQPIEKKFQITRKTLENLDKQTKLSILTKSDLICRDIDLFLDFKDIEVGLTISDLKEKIPKAEPFAPPNERRIDALRGLHEAGIRTYTFISPVIPNITDIQNIIEKTKLYTDYYIIELLNLSASRNFSISRESRRILKTDLSSYIKQISKYLNDVNVAGIYTHKQIKQSRL